MRNRIWYPSIEDAKKANKFAVDRYRATKGEKFEVSSHPKIRQAIRKCRRKKGNIEQKAAYLLIGFSDLHPFASANRRTGYILMNQFLIKNAGYVIAKRKKYTTQLFKEMRRRNVKEKEILKWYKANKKYKI